jgi:hypothetical protein
VTSQIWREPGGLAGPEYRLESVRDRLLQAPFAQEYVLDGVFRVLEWRDLAPLLRELFYLLVAYLVVTAAALVAVSSGRALAAGQAAASGSGAATAAGYVPLSASRIAPAARPRAAPVSGLAPREELPSRLDHELERAAASDQDLSLLLLALEPQQAGAFGQLAHQVLQAFPFRDLCFQYDERTCAVILPDKELSQSLKDARPSAQTRRDDGRWAAGFHGLAARAGASPNHAPAVGCSKQWKGWLKAAAGSWPR